MQWSTYLALFLAVFCAQSYSASAAGASVWTSPRNAEAFLASFSDSLRATGAFDASQMENIYAIRDVVVSTMEKMIRANKSGKDLLNALNTAFGSAVAEVAAASGGSAHQINAIKNALSRASMQQTGAIDYAFVNEIVRLVNDRIIHSK